MTPPFRGVGGGGVQHTVLMCSAGWVGYEYEHAPARREEHLYGSASGHSADCSASPLSDSCFWAAALGLRVHDAQFWQGASALVGVDQEFGCT
jgi:hypothetical protein